MWLSERKKRKNESCVVGTVSISGDKCGVVGFTECRNTAIYAPGGYIWKPIKGDNVLIMKNDSTEIIGQICDNRDIEPGEVCIGSCGGAEIRLGNDGKIYIRGEIIEERK